jgi:hypothetical protein
MLRQIWLVGGPYSRVLTYFADNALPDAKFEVLGAPYSLLSVSLSASQKLYTRRGTLVGLSGKSENVIRYLVIWLAKTNIMIDTIDIVGSRAIPTRCSWHTFSISANFFD